jgi:hypothetical protein
MTRDRIDELASELFAAAREERPGRELAERVERAAAREGRADAGVEPSVQLDEERPPERLAASGGRAGRAGGRAGGKWAGGERRAFRVLLAAVVVGGGVAALLLARSPDGVIMSAERVPVASSRSLQGSAGGPLDLDPPGDGDSEGVAERGAAERASDRAAGSGGALALPHGPSSPASKGTGSSGGANGSQAKGPAAGRAARDGAVAAPRSPSTSPTAAPAAAPTLANELGMLRQIRQALRGNDGAAALALLERYDTGEYGKSLSLEASVLRVEALDAVGRRAEAQALARRFVRENPDSPLAERAQSFISADPERQRESAAP